MEQQSAVLAGLAQMARTVEGAVQRVIEALLSGNGDLALEALQFDARINDLHIELEGFILDQLGARKRSANCNAKYLAAALKTGNDVRRLGSAATYLAQVILDPRSGFPRLPVEATALIFSVRGRVTRVLSAIICRKPPTPEDLLQAEDSGWQCRDLILQRVLAGGDLRELSTNLRWMRVTSHLDRLSDYSLRVAEGLGPWMTASKAPVLPLRPIPSPVSLEA